MVKHDRNTVGSLLTAPERGSGDGWQRLWPVLSASALRRRLVAALFCGGGAAHNHKAFGCGCGCTRRFLPSKAKPHSTTTTTTERRRTVQKGRTGRLIELIQAEPPEEAPQEEKEEEEEESDGEEETKDPENRERREENVMEMQAVVARLQLEAGRGDAARDVRRLAKADPEAREVIAELGAISPLLEITGDPEARDDERVDALYALLNLGIGNDRNKATIVEAGALHCMLRLAEPCTTGDASISSDTAAAVVANLLSLSALDANKPVIGSSGAIPFLVSTYRNPNPTAQYRDEQTRDDALRALYNLSLFPPNAPRLADASLVPALLAALEDTDFNGDKLTDAAHSERALALLSNIVAAAPEGLRELSRRGADAFPLLVDALGWSDAPRCQEAAAYVLMVMAHRSSPRDRSAMAEAGAHSALLELTLLGTPLAQKRASKVLEFLTAGKTARVAHDSTSNDDGVDGDATGCSMSAPLCGAVELQGHIDEAISEERKAVRRLVRQSLESNMRRITRRANAPPQPQYFPPPDRLRGLAGIAAAVSTDSSKSLPF